MNYNIVENLLFIVKLNLETCLKEKNKGKKTDKEIIDCCLYSTEQTFYKSFYNDMRKQ